MSQSEKQNTDRGGSSTRLTVLLLFLLVVGAGCIYEFAFARPAYQTAWEKIRKVDESKTSSEHTSEQILEMMGQEPFRVAEDLHDECVVHTYRWRSGLLVKNHDIHVVFTKLNPILLEKRPDLEGKLYYYSASAGQPLDLDANFPQEKQTLVENLNAPMMSVGGGGAPPPNQQGGGRRQRRNADDDGDDKDRGKQGDADSDKSDAAKSEGGETKDTEAKKDDAAEAGSDKKAEDKKGDDDKSGEEKKSDDDKSDG